jgi:hypothetical protein
MGSLKLSDPCAETQDELLHALSVSVLTPAGARLCLSDRTEEPSREVLHIGVPCSRASVFGEVRVPGDVLRLLKVAQELCQPPEKEPR